MDLSTLALIFAFISTISAPAIASDPVVDWSGEPLKVGVAYDMWGVGLWKGPIALGTTTVHAQNINYVINKPYRETDPFLPDPVIFYPANKSETLVRVGQDYNIAFQGDSKYFDVWKVNSDSHTNARNFITTGGQKDDNPGCWNIHSWFQFVLVNEFEHLYKLISNPQVCIHSRNHAEVTSIWKDGEDRLYLNEGYTDENSVVYLRFVEHEEIIRQVAQTSTWL